MSDAVQSLSGAGPETFVWVCPAGVSPPAETEPHSASVARAVEVDAPVTASRYFRIKPAADRLLTAVLLVVALPLMLVTALAIWLFEGRPLIYRQVRIGKGGRPFRILKFRSMCRDAEKRTGPVWSTDNDARITPLGRLLRRTHLDELPQLINVLLGDMNLIGPRPERPEFVEQLAEHLPRYRQRLAVRPGITGLAQLRLGYDRTVSDVARKVELDLQYIETATAVTDLGLLFGTVPYLLRNVIRKPGRETGTATRFDGQPPNAVIRHDRQHLAAGSQPSGATTAGETVPAGGSAIHQPRA